MIKLSGFAIFCLVATLVGSVSAWETKGEQFQPPRHRITLSVDGAASADDAHLLSTTLHECDVQFAGELEPNHDGPSRLVVSAPREWNLAACAIKVNQAQTPQHDRHPPALDLVLFVKVDEQSAKEALTACHRIHGVDGAASKADIIKGELHIRIVGNKAVSPEQIVMALREVGVTAQFVKSNNSLADVLSLCDG